MSEADAGATHRAQPGSAPRVIALIGLRASGKTTLGRALAERLARAFVDLDDELWKHAHHERAIAAKKRTSGELLRELGESAFRDVEARALRAVLARTDAFVLATGGGAVERAVNRELLSARCACVWLDAPDAVLLDRVARSTTDRPQLSALLPTEELARLRERRSGWYAELSERRIDTSASLQHASDALFAASTAVTRPDAGD